QDLPSVQAHGAPKPVELAVLLARRRELPVPEEVIELALVRVVGGLDLLGRTLRRRLGGQWWHGQRQGRDDHPGARTNRMTFHGVLTPWPWNAARGAARDGASHRAIPPAGCCTFPCPAPCRRGGPNDAGSRRPSSHLGPRWRAATGS